MKRRLMSANECDTCYRLRHGTTAKHIHAGRIKYVERPGPGRHRKVYYVDPRDAELEWGPKVVRK